MIFFFLFVLFRNLKDPSGKNLFMCCCTDLALESRDYDLLFGRMDALTGLRSQGLLDQFNNPHIDSKVCIFIRDRLLYYLEKNYSSYIFFFITGYSSECSRTVSKQRPV